MDSFHFASSEALVNIPLNLKIINLEGEQAEIPFSTLINRPDLRHIGSNASEYSDLYVTVQLWADSKPLTVPVQTSYKPFKNERRWNEWLELPVTFSQLPLTSQLAITIWDLSPTGGDNSNPLGHAIPFGGTTLPLFDKENTLHKGRQKCVVHRGKAADGLATSTTPSVLVSTAKRRNETNQTPEIILDAETEETARLSILSKKHEMGEIPRVDWLDQLVFRGMEKRRSNSSHFGKASRMRKPADRGPENNEEAAMQPQHPFDEEHFELNVELPRFDFPVVFSDHEYAPSPISNLQHLSSSQSAINFKPPPEMHLGPGIASLGDSSKDAFGDRLIRIYDPEMGARDNPAETKHRRLVRSHRTGIMDRDLRPNPKVRDELNNIMTYSPTQVLSPEEKDLVWRFRHHLTRDKKALTKFVKSTNWNDIAESKQAVLMLGKWTEIDVDDAIELLGPGFDNSAVRAYAVDRLRKSDDDELLLYLLQLVQALKFERISSEAPLESARDSSLAKFLIARASHNFLLGNYFHWYLMVELDDKAKSQRPEYRKLYMRVEYDFMTELVKLPDGEETRSILRRQAELISVLTNLANTIKLSRDSTAQKISQVSKFLSDPKNDLVNIDPPLPLPLDPTILLTGVHPEDTKVFRSSLSPIMVTFRTPSTASGRYTLIFKSGDDLRQDQLVIQIITLMDQLLRKENLDLKLTPYKILATSGSAGAVQFVKSVPLQALQQKHGSATCVQTYLRQNNPEPSAPLKIRKEVMNTFIRSCAGYCVITYFLGVGDRHLDNLLLSPNGAFFHADFGFILGRDPKPFAPALKLCTEMIEGMGGLSSTNYQTFKNYCFTAFTTLRKSSNLILNLFALMGEAGIQDIELLEGSGGRGEAVRSVERRFCLGVSEEESLRVFEGVLEGSREAVFPLLVDWAHGVMQGMKS